MQVSGEPNLSAKSSPVTGPALLHAPPENFLQLGALSSGFQGAEGGDHLQHACDLRNMGLTAGTGSPHGGMGAWKDGKLRSVWRRPGLRNVSLGPTAPATPSQPIVVPMVFLQTEVKEMFQLQLHHAGKMLLPLLCGCAQNQGHNM